MAPMGGVEMNTAKSLARASRLTRAAASLAATASMGLDAGDVRRASLLPSAPSPPATMHHQCSSDKVITES
jgi:hypothetical protein